MLLLWWIRHAPANAGIVAPDGRRYYAAGRFLRRPRRWVLAAIAMLFGMVRFWGVRLTAYLLLDAVMGIRRRPLRHLRAQVEDRRQCEVSVFFEFKALLAAFLPCRS